MRDVLYVHKVFTQRDLFASHVQSWDESFLGSQMVFLLDVPKAGKGNEDCAPLWLRITFSIWFVVIVSGVAVDMGSDQSITHFQCDETGRRKEKKQAMILLLNTVDPQTTRV